MGDVISPDVFRRYARHVPGCKMGPRANSCSCGYFSAMYDCSHEGERPPPVYRIVNTFRGKKGELRGYVEAGDRRRRHAHRSRRGSRSAPL